MRDHRNLSRPFSLALLITVCFLSSPGCGGEKVVPVSGTVTHNGQPVAGLVVSFVPEAATKTGVSTGQTDDEGKYELTVFKTGKSGAVVGTHKVWVSRPREPFVEPGDKEEMAKVKKQMKQAASAAAKRPPTDLTEILKKYGNLDKSPLTVEVKGGAPIDLKLD
jgi:hypothetical protein